jgi:hypothetical protein
MHVQQAQNACNGPNACATGPKRVQRGQMHVQRAQNACNGPNARATGPKRVQRVQNAGGSLRRTPGRRHISPTCHRNAAGLLDTDRLIGRRIFSILRNAILRRLRSDPANGSEGSAAMRNIAAGVMGRQGCRRPGGRRVTRRTPRVRRAPAPDHRAGAIARKSRPRGGRTGALPQACPGVPAPWRAASNRYRSTLYAPTSQT